MRSVEYPASFHTPTSKPCPKNPTRTAPEISRLLSETCLDETRLAFHIAHFVPEQTTASRKLVDDGFAIKSDAVLMRRTHKNQLSLCQRKSPPIFDHLLLTSVPGDTEDRSGFIGVESMKDPRSTRPFNNFRGPQRMYRAASTPRFSFVAFFCELSCEYVFYSFFQCFC